MKSTRNTKTIVLLGLLLSTSQALPMAKMLYLGATSLVPLIGAAWEYGIGKQVWKKPPVSIDTKKKRIDFHPANLKKYHVKKVDPQKLAPYAIMPLMAHGLTRGCLSKKAMARSFIRTPVASVMSGLCLSGYLGGRYVYRHAKNNGYFNKFFNN